MSASSSKMKDAFTHIYRTNAWKDSESKSGTGSSLKQTRHLLQQMEALFKELKIKRIVDVPCGDFNWMRHFPLKKGMHYTGGDIVDELIESNIKKYKSDNIDFKVIDLTRDPLPDCDIIIVRDCIAHLSAAEVRMVFDNINKQNYKYILISNYKDGSKNQDRDLAYKETRAWNLELPPFNLPPPMKVLSEDNTPSSADTYARKYMCLWSKQDFQINDAPGSAMKYIVSFTTSPTRIHKCDDMLQSILQQTRKADMVVLNIPDVFERTGEKYEVPEKISNQITINHCGRDWGPATKIVPTVELLKKQGFDPDNTKIIYLDDDMCYPKQMIESLEGVEREDCVWGTAGFDFVDLKIGQMKREDASISIIEAFNGVCVKLSVFKDDFIDYMDTHTKTPASRFSDDVILSNYFHKVGVPIKKFSSPGKYSFMTQQKLEKDSLHHGADGVTESVEIRYVKAVEELDKLNDRHFELYSAAPLLASKMKDAFTHIYRTNAWAGSESRSGSGSSLAQTRHLLDQMESLFNELNVQRIVDIPCGDFNWMQHFPLQKNMHYTGGDIVDELIESNIKKYKSDNIDFKVIDLTRDPLPDGDIIIVRDCVQHLSFPEVHKIFENIKKQNYKYILISSHRDFSENKLEKFNHRIGKPWNLELSPFNLPPPLKVLAENNTDVRHKKYMCLWDRQSFEGKQVEQSVLTDSASSADTKVNVTTVLNVYKRVGYLADQIEALRNQTVPTDIWIDYTIPEGGAMEDLSKIAPEAKITIRANQNLYHIGRFYYALNVPTEYVFICDDDIIPGKNYIQHCLNTMEKVGDCVLTCYGIKFASGQRHYSPQHYKQHGWLEGKNQKQMRPVQVDMGGHSWFLKREHLSYITRENPPTRETGEDIHFSYCLQKYANIPVYVPPYIAGEYDNWGCQHEKGMKYGTDENASYKDPKFISMRSRMMVHYLDRGWTFINDKQKSEHNMKTHVPENPIELIRGKVTSGAGGVSRIPEDIFQSRCKAARAKLVKGSLNLRLEDTQQALDYLGQPDFETDQSDHADNPLRWWQVELTTDPVRDVPPGKTFVVRHALTGPDNRLDVLSEVHFRTALNLKDASTVQLRKTEYEQSISDMPVSALPASEESPVDAKLPINAWAWLRPSLQNPRLFLLANNQHAGDTIRALGEILKPRDCVVHFNRAFWAGEFRDHPNNVLVLRYPGSINPGGEKFHNQGAIHNPQFKAVYFIVPVHPDTPYREPPALKDCKLPKALVRYAPGTLFANISIGSQASPSTGFITWFMNQMLDPILVGFTSLKELDGTSPVDHSSGHEEIYLNAHAARYLGADGSLLLNPQSSLPEQAQTLMRTAVRKGRLDELDRLLQFPEVDINQPDASGQTALVEAVILSDQHFKVFEHLLGVEGIDIFQPGFNKFDPLGMAIHRGAVEVIKRLLADPRMIEGRRSALPQDFLALVSAPRELHISKRVACLNRLLGDPELAELLGPARDAEGRNALLLTVEPPFRPDTYQPDQHGGYEQFIRDTGFAPPEYRPALLETLLACPEIDATATDKHGNNALHLAAANKHVRCVELLLADGRVDSQARNAEGLTPLDCAKQAKHRAIIEALKAHNPADAPPPPVDDPPSEALETLFTQGPAPPNPSDAQSQAWQREFLQWVSGEKGGSFEKRRDTLRLLHKKRKWARLLAPARDKENRTALMRVIEHKGSGLYRPDILRVLLACPEIDLSATDNHGNNALHLAGASGNARAVTYLLGDGRFDLDVRNDAGQTPLECAEQGGHPVIVAQLRARAENLALPRVKPSQPTPETDTLTFVTVLTSSGGEYLPEHVERLRQGIAEHCNVPHRFFCLSDQPLHCPWIPLTEDWEGWWSKLEIFKHNFGPTVYFDLDTVIIDNLDWMVEAPKQFSMIKDFRETYHNSGVMAWTGDKYRHIADKFKPKQVSYYDARWPGDGGWIREQMPDSATLQKRFPDKIISWKISGWSAPGASVVCFYGTPRLWEVEPPEETEIFPDQIVLVRQKLMKRNPELHWREVDQECEKLLALFRQPGAKSMVRLGDGEQEVLLGKRSEWILQKLTEAIRSSDCLGLPNSYNHPPGEIHPWKEPMMKTLKERYQIDANSFKQVSSVIFIWAPELLGQLAAGKRILWITSGADKIVENLSNPSFRDYYGLHDIVDNFWINNAPAGTHLKEFPRAPVTPEQLENDIHRQLAQVENFDLAFVGAGMVGKFICHYIKTVLGKSAVDVGSIMSAMQGVRDRGAFRANAINAPVVWNPNSNPIMTDILKSHRKTFSILTPTRNRPGWFKRFTDSVYENAEHKDRVELMVYVDLDDPSIKKYRQLETDSPYQIKFIYGDPVGPSKSWNILAEQCSGDVLILGNDDVIYRTANWDILVEKEVAKYPDNIYLAWMDDKNHGGNLSTFPMVSRMWYETLGYFVPDECNHSYVDTWVHDIGKRINRLHFIPHVVGDHIHFLKGRSNKDDTYSRIHQNSLIARDRDIFEKKENQEKRKKDSDKLMKVIETFVETNNSSGVVSGKTENKRMIKGTVISGHGAIARLPNATLQARSKAADAKLVKGSLNVRVENMEQTLDYLGSPDFVIPQANGNDLRWWQVKLSAESGRETPPGKTFAVRHIRTGPADYLDVLSETHFRSELNLTDGAPVLLRKAHSEDFVGVVATMCMWHPRWPGSMKTVRSLEGQVDTLYLCLNDFWEVPEELKQDWIEILHFGHNLGDASRVYLLRNAGSINAHVITCDDDIEYPATYVQDFLAAHKEYPNALLTHHGDVARFKDGKFERYTWGLRIIAEDHQTKRVCLPGSGVSFIPGDIFNQMEFTSLVHFNQLDVHVACNCHKLGIEMIGLFHTKDYIKYTPPPGQTVHKTVTQAHNRIEKVRQIYASYGLNINEIPEEEREIEGVRNRPITSAIQTPPQFQLGMTRRILMERRPELDWEGVEKQCQIVFQMFHEPGPKSLIRAGDGERNLLRSKTSEFLTLGIADAMKHADCLGLPDHHQPGRTDHEWKDHIFDTLRDDYQVEIDQSTHVSSLLFCLAPELIGWLAANKRVVWITHGAENIVKNMDNTAFKDYYNLHEIEENYWIHTVPRAAGNPLPAGDPKKGLEDIYQKLTEVPDFDLAIVGAGAIGKMTCQHIKTVYGKAAIDIGGVMSALQGVRNYTTFYRNGWLNPLVWDPDQAKEALETHAFENLKPESKSEPELEQTSPVFALSSMPDSQYADQHPVFYKLWLKAAGHEYTEIVKPMGLTKLYFEWNGLASVICFSDLAVPPRNSSHPHYKNEHEFYEGGKYSHIPLFKAHYSREHEYPKHVFPFAPTLGPKHGRQKTIQDFLGIYTSFETDPKAGFTSKQCAKYERRRVHIHNLLKQHFPDIDLNPNDTPLAFWNAQKTALAAICVPGHPTDMLLDRGQMELMMLGVCTISPYLPEVLLGDIRPEPNVDYLQCADDYSDLIDICKSLTPERSKQIGNNARAKMAALQPKPFWDYVIRTLQDWYDRPESVATKAAAANMIEGKVISGSDKLSRIPNNLFQARCKAAEAELVKGSLNVQVDDLNLALDYLGTPDFTTAQTDTPGNDLRWWRVELTTEPKQAIPSGKTFVIRHTHTGPGNYLDVLSEVHFRTEAGLDDGAIVRLSKLKGDSEH